MCGVVHGIDCRGEGAWWSMVSMLYVLIAKCCLRKVNAPQSFLDNNYYYGPGSDL